MVTATPNAGAPVRTPIAVTREIESYDVTVRGIDYDGSPSTNFYYRFIGIEKHTIHKSNATGPTTVRLPALLGMTFPPNLDDHNAAPGKRFTMPVTVQRNDSDSPGPVSTPAVEVSYDDGKTWKPANIRRVGSQWAATVDHPRDARFVSLRSSVSDPDGNAPRQTLIRAHALK